jgi:CheY-like chemotaxis protein
MTAAVSKPHFSVIIVDDSDFNRSTIKAVFKRVFKDRDIAHLITTAVDGQEGWAICQRESFHLYVIDYEMPFMKGVELCRRILAEKPQANIVLFSASKIEEVEQAEGPIEKVIKYIYKDIVALRMHLELQLIALERGKA